MSLPAQKKTDHDEGKAAYYKALHDLANKIHSAKNINEILISLKKKILTLFDADRMTIYVVDGRKKEIFSRFKAGPASREIRLPINNKSIAGYTANNAEITNIVNAYDDQELSKISRDLSFDKSWDRTSEYTTKQILTVPIFYQRYTIGVMQLVNKKSGVRFTPEDQESAIEMAKVLGIAFYNQQKLSKKTEKKTRFDYLLENRLVSEKELEQAMAAARKKKTSI